MFCLKCKIKLKCVETRSELNNYTTYRRYRCNKCGDLVYTEEYRVVDDEAKGQIYNLKKANFIKEIEKQLKKGE